MTSTLFIVECTIAIKYRLLSVRGVLKSLNQERGRLNFWDDFVFASPFHPQELLRKGDGKTGKHPPTNFV